MSDSPNSATASKTATDAVVISIDCGTTGIRCFAVDNSGVPRGFSYREFTQYFPQPGWVEHDATEIWAGVQTTLVELLDLLGDSVTIAAIGITNQRETAVAWNRSTGLPVARAIVWQDRRTAARCDELAAAGHLPMVRSKTGLVLDPYFSASKMEWMLTKGEVERSANLCLGTVDDWILWNLTGGTKDGVHATDPSNASRTMLYDITSRQWSHELCDMFSVPMSVLGEVRPSSGRFGKVASTVVGGALTGTPISGILGDQQSALFGQACLSTGMAKNTYGTGSFLLMNIGRVCPPPSEGLLTTVAWDLGSNGGFAYALEGAVFVTGAAIQWLRDGLGIINTAAEVGPLAASVPDSEGVFVVPAFAGLGSPWWDPYARGAVLGLTRGVGRAHIARATVEAIAYQVRDVVDRMTEVSGTTLAELRVDGGASVMDLLMQLQADQLGVPVSRPQITETTAVGAAYAAGLAEGVWSSTADVSAAWKEQTRVLPQRAKSAADKDHAQWLRAVERSRNWAIE
jgi:glycerol kinase